VREKMTQYRYPEVKVQRQYEKPIGPEHPVGGTPVKAYKEPGVGDKLKGLFHQVSNGVDKAREGYDKVKTNPTLNKAKDWAVERGRQINYQNDPLPAPHPQRAQRRRKKQTVIKYVTKPTPRKQTQRALPREPNMGNPYGQPHFHIPQPPQGIPKHLKHLF
jgi:hypothetical protein